MATRAEWPDFWSRWGRGQWEPELRDLIYETIEPGDLFVDVGAWIGPVSAWALEAGAQVVAIEPDPVAAAEFRRGWPEAELWPVAITERPGAVRLATKRAGEFGDSESRIAADAGLPVLGLPLQDVLAGRKPKFVKIDVEGYERVLAPSLLPWLAEQGAVVNVSLHGQLLDRDHFENFAEVRWPSHPRGDIVAIP